MFELKIIQRGLYKIKALNLESAWIELTDIALENNWLDAGNICDWELTEEREHEKNIVYSKSTDNIELKYQNIQRSPGWQNLSNNARHLRDLAKKMNIHIFFTGQAAKTQTERAGNPESLFISESKTYCFLIEETRQQEYEEWYSAYKDIYDHDGAWIDFNFVKQKIDVRILDSETGENIGLAFDTMSIIENIIAERDGIAISISMEN